MQKFLMKARSLIAVVAIIFAYNNTISVRAKDEEIAKLNAEIKNSDSAHKNSDNSKAADYKDGTYEGSAEGFGGTVSVEVKVKEHQISEINVVSADKEDGAYLAMAEDIIPAIIDAQNTEVDTISGATFSSTGIKNATEEALKKAVE